MNRPTSFVLNVGDCIIPCMRVYIYLHYFLSMPLLHNVLGVVLKLVMYITIYQVFSFQVI